MMSPALRMNSRLPQKQVDVVNLRGGIDLASTFMRIQEGAALDLLNFEPGLEGGYRRVSGYERLDGRPAPSAAMYWTMLVSNAGPIADGDLITGATSGATARVFRKEGNLLGITALVGTFEVDEVINGGPTVVSLPELEGRDDIESSEQWLVSAQNWHRSQIQAVPGEGPVLGAVQYKDRAYAFREDSGVVKMWRSSSSGWEQVTFDQVIFFTNGTMTETQITAGSTIEGAVSNAVATVKKFVRSGGSFETDASGFMVIEMVSGTFNASETIEVLGVGVGDTDGAEFDIEFQPGGRFEFVQHNFYGGAATFNLYGCDGANPAWEFDGETLSPIYFQAPEQNPDWNTPQFIAAHKGHLFLSFPGGTIAHSGLGEPLSFSALLGAAEFGLGSECTGMAPRSGDVLAIYTQARVFGLYGSSAADWNLQIISETFGAKPYTVQLLGTVYATDEKGVAPLERVNAYGDFESATVSRFVKPVLERYQGRIVGTVVVRERNQYRIMFDDGTGLLMSDDQYMGEGVPSFSTIRFEHVPTCLSNGPDQFGRETILFGTAEGYVMQMERGFNFDGQPVEFAYRSPFMNQRAPHMRKSYRRIYVDLETEKYVRLQITTELSYSDFKVPSSPVGEVAIFGGGGYYDLVDWDNVYWDAVTFSSQGVSLTGTGRNISILVYGLSDSIRPFTIQTLEIHYLARRLKRGE